MESFRGHLSELCVFPIAFSLRCSSIPSIYLIFVRKRMGCTFPAFFSRKDGSEIYLVPREYSSQPCGLAPLLKRTFSDEFLILLYFLLQHQKSWIAAMNVFPYIGLPLKKLVFVSIFVFLPYILSSQGHGALLLI